MSHITHFETVSKLALEKRLSEQVFKVKVKSYCAIPSSCTQESKKQQKLTLFCQVTDSLGFSQFSDVDKMTLLKCFISLCKASFSLFSSCSFFPLNKIKYKDPVNVSADGRCQTDSLRK